MMMSFVPMMASAIEIYIDLTIVGQANLTLEVVSGDSIDNIKEKIQEKTGFSPDAQRLFWAKKSLRTGARWQITIFRRKARCACVCKRRYSSAQTH